MKKILLLMLGLSIISLLLVVRQSNAYEFPIQELANCRNTRECHLYCEIPQNRATCWSYSIYGNKSEVLGDETPEASLSEIGVTFPIAELGNCTDTKTCKAYCGLPANKTACSEFATRFQKPHLARLVEKAKEELGCTTAQECRAFCTEETNKEACIAFARKYHLGGLIKDRLVEAIQQELGCTDRESCKKMCQLPENKDRCQAIAKRVNPDRITPRERLVEAAKEKLGCTSFTDCRTLCQNKDNAELCRNFGAAVTERIKNEIKTKGNCKTTEECRLLCEQNPALCPQFPKTRDASKSGDLKLKSLNDKPKPTQKPELLNKRESAPKISPLPLNQLKTNSGQASASSAF